MYFNLYKIKGAESKSDGQKESSGRRRLTKKIKKYDMSCGVSLKSRGFIKKQEIICET